MAVYHSGVDARGSQLEREITMPRGSIYQRRSEAGVDGDGSRGCGRTRLGQVAGKRLWKVPGLCAAHTFSRWQRTGEGEGWRSHCRRGIGDDEGEALSRVQERSTRRKKEGVEWEEGGESVVADSRFEEAQG
jgi:hypothetical protein